MYFAEVISRTAGRFDQYLSSLVSSEAHMYLVLEACRLCSLILFMLLHGYNRSVK